MNLYSNKQKWKIFLLAILLVLIGTSVFFSNQIVEKVRLRERERARIWADAIKKKAELVQLTNQSFNALKQKEASEMDLWMDATISISRQSTLNQSGDFELPLKIISRNKSIPVIVTDQFGKVASSINLPFSVQTLKQQFPKLSAKEVQRVYNDSLQSMSHHWKAMGHSFTVEIYAQMFMTYSYGNSYNIEFLEYLRDSLITAFNRELILNKNLVPILLIDKKADTVIASNFPKSQLTSKNLPKIKKELSVANPPIEVVFSEAQNSVLYYDKSYELRQLQYFPYIQFVMIGLFIFVAYIVFSTFRKAEQNQVWAGMAKETAHQLGTPLSSLMAWIELLDAKGGEEQVVSEMRKDIQRLETVTNRFSKIGSETKMEEGNIVETMHSVLTYLQTRVSKNIQFHFQTSNPVLIIKHNQPLMEWVGENLIKNAVDAMRDSGSITVHLSESDKKIYIDVSDTGKGIPSKDFKNVFKPGFSSKKRGWGLGLSLVKRIVTEYHHGKIFVLKSELGIGTTFRIILYK